MVDRLLTIPQLKKLIRKFTLKWRGKLWLGMWRINNYYHDNLSASEHTRKGVDVVGACTTDWRYLTADIDYGLKPMQTMTDNQIERIVVHELCHVVVNQMREPTYDNEESVVSHMTAAWAFHAGIND
jgi:predicted aminopeptidase